MDAEAQLEGFIARFSDDIAARTRAARRIMRARLPGAIELVYDNYNALAIGYGPNEKARQIIFSIAVYPRWISLFLVGGQALDDPEGLLTGEGATMRHIVLATAETLETPAVARLMDQALERAVTPLDPGQPFRTVIRSVAAKQRPRRPT